jgi:hypothetical protein
MNIYNISLKFGFRTRDLATLRENALRAISFLEEKPEDFNLGGSSVKLLFRGRQFANRIEALQWAKECEQTLIKNVGDLLDAPRVEVTVYDASS